MNGAAPFRSPRHLLCDAARAHGDRVAVIEGEERLTYSDLAARTERLARALRDAGVGAGVQVALMAPNSAAWVVWFHAIWQAGGIAMPIAATLAPDEAKELVLGAGIPFLAGPEGSEAAKSIAGAAPAAARDGGIALRPAVRGAAAIDTVPWTEGGLIARQSSSGSTGRPKHLFRTEYNFHFDLINLDRSLGLGRGEVMLCVHPLHTLPGIKDVNSAFYLGGSVSILPRFLPGPVLEAARRDSVTVFRVSPAMIEALNTCLLRKGDDRAFAHMKLMISTGARLRSEVREAFLARYGVPIRDQYGSTETMTISIDLEDPYEEGRMGRPLPGIDLAVFDAEGRRLPAGAVGQVGIKSPAACESYANDLEASARVFRNGWVFPGDRGYFDAQGRLHVVGRDNVINIGGYKVDPLEVERAIRGALPVGEVVVLAGERGGLPAIRVVVEADPTRVTPAVVVAACRARLSPYKVPAEVEVRERIARSESGKIVKSSLDRA